MPIETKNEIPYAAAKLRDAVRIIKQSIHELPVLRARLAKHSGDSAVQEDLQQQRLRLVGAIDTAALALAESDLMDLSELSAKLRRAIAAYDLSVPDYKTLCGGLRQYLNQLPSTEPETAETTNASIIGHLMSKVKMGYYPTDLDHIDYITKGLEFPMDIAANVLDPCCGCGTALARIALNHNCQTYGIELDEYRADEAQERLNWVGYGSYFGSRISNEAFHLMLLNPPYLAVMTEGGSNTRNEKRFLVESIEKLMIGGVMVYIIPYYRMTLDICRVLCNNFEDVTMWAFVGAEFASHKQVAVVGARCKRKDGSQAAYDLAAQAREPSNIPLLSELPEKRYHLPATVKKVELFKGAVFNVTELARQLARSDSFTRLFMKSELDSTVKRPLLPLNIGQVGLIGGSGLINGLVDCETPHIIKGRIVKEVTVRSEENYDKRDIHTSTTLYQTKSNKMIFNILTPDGFISLTDSTGSNVEQVENAET